MNLDFHYYVTYLAARDAGFSDGDAEKIAYSAQYVDVSTTEMIKPELLPGIKPTATLESGITMAKGILWTSTSKLDETKKVWSSFHFLPGNMHSKDEKKTYTGSKEWGVFPWKATYDKKDEANFEYMCLPNSVLSENMVNSTTKFSAYPFFNHLIGTRMHVLADTWAHTYYAGLNSYWINDTDKVKWTASGTELPFNTVKDMAQLSVDKPFYCTIRGFECKSYFYLGHGRMGHLPDEPYAKYTYTPKWSSTPITKDNPADYLKAYKQLVKAMDCIRTGKPYVRNTFASISQTTEAELVKAFARTDYKESIAAQIWNPIIKKLYNKELPNFENNKYLEQAKKADNKLTTDYYYFNRAAELHADFVSQYVHDAESAPVKKSIDYNYAMLHINAKDTSDRRLSLNINFASHDNSHWTATYQEGRFRLYPNSDKKLCHTSSTIDYITHSGELKRARFANDSFAVYKKDTDGNATVCNSLDYKHWDMQPFTTRFLQHMDAGADFKADDIEAQNKKVFLFRVKNSTEFCGFSTRLFMNILRGIFSLPFICEYYQDNFNCLPKDGGAEWVCSTLAYDFNKEPTDQSICTSNVGSLELPPLPQGDKLKISGHKFILNDSVKDSIEIVNWDGVKYEILIADWYKF